MTTIEKNIAIAEMLGAIQEQWYPPNKDTKTSGIYLAMQDKKFFPDGKRYCGDSMLRYDTDANWQLGALEWIEELDVSDRHYQWEFDGEKHSNFEGFVTEIMGKTCEIWMNLSLDPSREIVRGEGTTKKEGIFEALYLFSQYLKQVYGNS